MTQGLLLSYFVPKKQAFKATSFNIFSLICSMMNEGYLGFSCIALSVLLLRACSGFCFELQMAKVHSNFVTKMLM
jgi:hypothetical protein